ncbi:MAG: glycosyltransferase family 39 protein [Candidatus Levyibacteriota bacterium]
MIKLVQFAKKYWFEISVFLILIFAIFLRFYNYENRWGLAYDQARDVIVAKEAIRQFKIPLIGPFSSAGQFVYGPQWFWVLMFLVSVFPSSIITPWIILTLLYVAMVFLLIIIGKELGGKFFAVILGVLSAVSPAQISQSINLTSPSFVSILSVLSIYFLIKFLKDGKKLFYFLMSFCVGTAINIHFQALGLLFLIPIAFIFGKRSLKTLFSSVIGLMSPFIPLIIFDLSNKFFESRNLLDYYLYGQYRIYVPNRWLTYAGEYWPRAWSLIIGGEKIIGYLFMILVAFFILFLFKKRENKKFMAVLLGFIFSFLTLRYYRGERYDAYLVFLHPFVLILSSWTIWRLFKLNKILAMLLLFAAVFFSIKLEINEIKNATNVTAFNSSSLAKSIIETYPGKNFALYDHAFKSNSYSLPLALYLDKEGKLSDDGYRVGFGSKLNTVDYPKIKNNKIGFDLRDLNTSSSAELQKNKWVLVNPSEIYKMTEDWYKK